ncbi:MAG: FtsL-like putative cell division protein [Bacteroides sp.]|jgi:hypothetical protein|nr:FtsL-like putative cell division protein [Bacteroides sp.]
MGANKYRQEKKKKTATKKGAVSRFIHNILDGSILTREGMAASLPFFFFLTGLALFLISNTYYAEKKAREVEALRKEIVELRTRHTLTKSELMYLSNQSEIARRLHSRGFVESTVPPRQIPSKISNGNLLKKLIQ